MAVKQLEFPTEVQMEPWISTQYGVHHSSTISFIQQTACAMYHLGYLLVL